MDEFGVLVQSIGFKGQRNSAPMADLKNKRHVTPPKSIFNNNNNNNNNNFNSTQKNYSDFEDGFGNFKSDSTRSGIDGFDLDSMFMGSGGLGVNKSIYANDDIFGGVPAQQSASADHFFGGLEMGSNGSRRKSEETKKMNSSGFDDLIPGFGEETPIRNRENTGKIRPPPPAGDSVKPVFSSAGDPFIVLEQSSSQVYTSGNNSKPKGQDVSKKSTFSFVDDLDVLATGGEQKNTSLQSDFFQNENVANDLDSIFNMARQPTNASWTKSTEVDPVFDSLYQNKKTSMEERGPTVEKTPGTSTSKKEATPRKNIVDDFLFFGEVTPSSDVFQEVEGESDERRKARFNQHIRTQERMAKALAEKNQRDIRTQQEQDEKHRVAETMNDNIKRWAAGKEGNLRALLSSLQHVLWSECGWQPVSLTDLITSVSVKKVYFKATLCVHPDKVQQKGATVQQKYIAEKVFDLLKEAWNKFNAEELR